MSTKTIEVDTEAYEALTRQKAPDQSFSDLIKSRFGQRFTAAEFLRAAAEARISKETLDAVDELIRARGESPATAPDL
jgi:predicted CopG family antitoxin